jgi:hypothetical protein
VPVGAGVGEGGLDLGAQARLVGLDRQQPVGAPCGDRPGDGGGGGDGVDGDERALRPVLGAEPVEERRDRRQHPAGGGGEGGDEVQRRGGRGCGARSLAIDRDEAGLVRPALAHPAGEGGGEERRVIRFIRMVSQRSPGTPCA